MNSVPSRSIFGVNGPQVQWLAVDGARFTEPFFDETLRRLQRLPANARERRIVTPIHVLADSNTPAGVPLAGLIFHVSRCGSTLIAQMLAALPSNIVISEAPVLDDILQAPRHDPRITDDERVAWLRGAVNALTQRRHPEEERAFVKLDCWSIFDLPVIRRAFPGVPLLFVHRHPVEVLVSLMRMPSMTLIRDTVTPEQLGLSSAERDALSREEHAAAILGALFREAGRHRAALVPVAYQQLPDLVWEGMPGCTFTHEDRALLQAASARDAKNPGQSFASDVADKRREASPALLSAAARWAEPHYARWLAEVGAVTER